jgi:hypothetical protein
MQRKNLPILINFIITLVIIMFFMIVGILYYLSIGESIFAPETVEIFIPFIPGPIITDLLFLLLAPILGFFVIFYTLAPYWTKLLIGIHKILSKLGGNPRYGVVKLGKRISGRMLFFRAMVVSFFTFSLAVFLVELLVGLGVVDGFLLYSSGIPIFDKVVQVFVACLFLGIITILIFLPVWNLEDSGLTSYQVSTGEEDERSPVDIQGVHAPLAGALSGYAGLATVLSWITFIVMVYPTISFSDPSFIVLILFILLPFITAGFFSIPIFLYEKTFPRLIDRLEAHWDYEHMKPPQFEKES